MSASMSFHVIDTYNLQLEEHFESAEALLQKLSRSEPADSPELTFHESQPKPHRDEKGCPKTKPGHFRVGQKIVSCHGHVFLPPQEAHHL